MLTRPFAIGEIAPVFSADVACRWQKQALAGEAVEVELQSVLDCGYSARAAARFIGTGPRSSLVELSDQ